MNWWPSRSVRESFRAMNEDIMDDAEATCPTSDRRNRRNLGPSKPHAVVFGSLFLDSYIPNFNFRSTNRRHTTNMFQLNKNQKRRAFALLLAAASTGINGQEDGGATLCRLTCPAVRTDLLRSHELL